LNAVSGIELGERQQRAGYGRLGSEVSPHGVQRDPRQDQASLAATRCSPRAYPHSAHTWCGGFIAWQRGHFWIAIRGAAVCVLRARFFRFDVLRFGTAIGQVEN
jgi:hypothetical protein